MNKSILSALLGAGLATTPTSAFPKYQSGGVVPQASTINISPEALSTAKYEQFSDKVIWDKDKNGNNINPSYGYGFLIHEGPARAGINYNNYTSKDGVINNGKVNKNLANSELNRRIVESRNEISNWYNTKYGKNKFENLPSQIQNVIVDLNYNMGQPDFTGQFKNFWSYVSGTNNKPKSFSKAADELRYKKPIYGNKNEINTKASIESKYWGDIGADRWDEVVRGKTDILHKDGIQGQDMTDNRGWNAWHIFKNISP
jgi:hypothetical protein